MLLRISYSAIRGDVTRCSCVLET